MHDKPGSDCGRTCTLQPSSAPGLQHVLVCMRGSFGSRLLAPDRVKASEGSPSAGCSICCHSPSTKHVVMWHAGNNDAWKGYTGGTVYTRYVRFCTLPDWLCRHGFATTPQSRSRCSTSLAAFLGPEWHGFLCQVRLSLCSNLVQYRTHGRPSQSCARLQTFVQTLQASWGRLDLRQRAPCGVDLHQIPLH